MEYAGLYLDFGKIRLKDCTTFTREKFVLLSEEDYNQVFLVFIDMVWEFLLHISDVSGQSFTCLVSVSSCFDCSVIWIGSGYLMGRDLWRQITYSDNRELKRYMSLESIYRPLNGLFGISRPSEKHSPSSVSGSSSGSPHQESVLELS